MKDIELPGLFITIYLLGLWSTHAWADWTFEPGRHVFVANESFQYLCTTESLHWSAVLQRANELRPTNRKNLGFKVDEDCWSIIKIDNRSAQVERAFLEHGLSLTSRLDIFHETKGSLRQEKTLGLHVPFVEWSVDYRLPIFDLRLEPGLNTIVVRQKSRDVMVLDWRLYSPENFYSRIVTELLLFGGFFSICVALAFYNIVIYFVNREISHVFYFCYLNLYALAQLYLVGLLKQLALPTAGAGVHQLGLITIAAALGMTSYFVYYFLDFPAYKPWFRRMIHTFAWMQWIVVVLSLTDQILWAAIFCQMFSLLGSVMAVLSAAIAVKRRHPLANYFIIAWTMLIVGNVIQVMHLQGLVPDVPWVVSMNFVGASFEAIIISYALAHKMRLGRLQEAQKRRHAFSQLEKMVHPHQIEQMKRGDILETTMPHASGDAVVLCLDIIASTSSQIENLSNFLRRFFDRCEILMSRDYKGEELSASGYRIKEMGDGFLCAVGCPFMTPPGRSPREVAIELAFGFLEAFDQEFSQTVSAERTFCSLGLAHGSIQGFFTVSGIRSYELFGDSIVLATRYEGLRKQWPPERPGHVMTLQHRLYECLPPHYQSLFQCHKLKPGAGAIRNDADAEAFYRGIFPSGAAARILANTDPTRREDLAS